MLDFLIIAPTPFYANRGCHMRIRGEAEALQKKGRTILILTYKEGGNVPGLTIIRSLIGTGMKKGVAATWRNIPAGFFLFWNVLYETIYRRPKILYGHLFEGAAIGIVVKYIVIPLSLFRYSPFLVLDAQGGLVEEMVSYGMLRKETFLTTLFRWLEKFILFFPDQIFTSSIQCAESLRKISFQSSPISLPDGISLFQKGMSEKKVKKNRGDKKKSLTEISFSAAENSLVERWIKENKTVLVYTGSYSPAKGFPDFIEKCLPELLNNDDIRFLFGGGSIASIFSLRDLIKNNPNKIISFPDLNLKNLLFFSLLGDIAVDCKPSQTSESSGKILNYMAAGLPVVCFNQKSNRFFLKKGGLYAKNYIEFRDNIIELAENPCLRKEMEDKNLKRAWNRFTWKQAAEKILDTIKV